MPNLITAHKSFRVLGASGVGVSHTGDTNETTLATVSVPAGALGTNGILRVHSLWSVNNDASNKSTRVRLGGISGTIFMDIGLPNLASFELVRMIWLRNSAASQVSASAADGSPGTSGAAVTTGVIDTSAAVDLVLTGQLADGTDTITLEAYTVELLYQA